VWRERGGCIRKTISPSRILSDHAAAAWEAL
jgi:hypothetical protein